MPQSMTKEDEILLILQEELAELIQAISKIKRFGLDNNIEQFKQEMADVLTMLDLVFTYGVVPHTKEEIKELIVKKQEKLKIYSNIYK